MTMATGKGSAPLYDSKAKPEAEDAANRPSVSGDSPKRQGDKLGAGPVTKATASEPNRSGDSPKRQGDELRHAVAEAAKR